MAKKLSPAMSTLADEILLSARHNARMTLGLGDDGVDSPEGQNFQLSHAEGMIESLSSARECVAYDREKPISAIQARNLIAFFRGYFDGRG